MLKNNRITCIPTVRYGSSDHRHKEQLPGNIWLEDMVEKIQVGKDPPLEQILLKDFTTIEFNEVVKSMAVVDYLRRERREDFLKLVEVLREQWPPGRVNPRSKEAREAHLKAFAAIGTHPTLFDQEFRKRYRLGE